MAYSFIDILAFQQVLLLMAAVIVCYVGVLAAFAMRRNDAAALKSTLRGAAVPVGAIAGVSIVIALYNELVWPFPPFIGQYNILFNDAFLLFAATMVVLSISLAAQTKLQFAGLFGLVAGGVTIAYGWCGYGDGLTKDPLETFLLYGAFGLASVLAFPATLITDHYLTHPESSLFAAKAPLARSRPSLMGASRAVQPVVPGTASTGAETAPTVTSKFRVPVYFNAALIVFLAMIALAAVAALLYLNTTLPAHMASPP